MSVALNPMSLEDFLNWESRQEFKYEFDEASFPPEDSATASGT
jgi:hypothetical protein